MIGGFGGVILTVLYFGRRDPALAGCGCFSLNGGSGSFAYRIIGGLSAVGEIGADHQNDLRLSTPPWDLDRVT